MAILFIYLLYIFLRLLLGLFDLLMDLFFACLLLLWLFSFQRSVKEPHNRYIRARKVRKYTVLGSVRTHFS